MRNEFYDKTIMDDYNEKERNFLNLGDFIKICDRLKLPVFEVEIINNPFSEPHRTVETKIHENMSAYRETMPDWSAREYDHERDMALGYYPVENIKNGEFEIHSGNSSANYRWHFEIAGQCVVVHSMISFTD